MKDTDNDPPLLPADLDEILEDFGFLLENHTGFKDRESVYGSYKRDRKALLVIFPLKVHPIHGITGLRAYEKYDDTGTISRSFGASSSSL